MKIYLVRGQTFTLEIDVVQDKAGITLCFITVSRCHEKTQNSLSCVSHFQFFLTLWHSTLDPLVPAYDLNLVTLSRCSGALNCITQVFLSRWSCPFVIFSHASGVVTEANIIC